MLPDPARLHIVTCGPADAPRTYRLRVPRLLDRVALTREIASLGGRQHAPQTLLRAMLDGVRAGMSEGEERARIEAALEGQIAAWDAFAAAVQSGDQD